MRGRPGSPYERACQQPEGLVRRHGPVPRRDENTAGPTRRLRMQMQMRHGTGGDRWTRGAEIASACPALPPRHVTWRESHTQPRPLPHTPAPLCTDHLLLLPAPACTSPQALPYRPDSSFSHNPNTMSERGAFRGRGGGRGGDRGPRGGGRGGGGGGGGGAHAGGQTERPKKENILDLSKYMDKQITVKFSGGREGMAIWSLCKEQGPLTSPQSLAH